MCAIDGVLWHQGRLPQSIKGGYHSPSRAGGYHSPSREATTVHQGPEATTVHQGPEATTVHNGVGRSFNTRMETVLTRLLPSIVNERGTGLTHLLLMSLPSPL